MTDNFQGDNAKLIECINALLSMDASGSLRPHGVGGHGRKLLQAAASRLEALSHAAGQEAVAWRYMYYDSDGWTYQSERPNDPPAGNPHGKVIEALYLTPAQPPASAEVGRDAAGKWELVPSGFLIDGPNGTAMVLDRAFIEPKIAALCENNGDDPEDYTATELYMKAWRGRAVDMPTMAASSGRNGDAT